MKHAETKPEERPVVPETPQDDSGGEGENDAVKTAAEEKEQGSMARREGEGEPCQPGAYMDLNQACHGVTSQLGNGEGSSGHLFGANVGYAAQTPNCPLMSFLCSFSPHHLVHLCLLF